jgi:hypothetical protein
VLNGKLILHGEDVEALCGKVVTLSRLELTYHEREDLLAYLIEECWELSLRYRPGGIGFGAYANTTLKKRAIGWDQRIRRRRLKWQFKDRTYQRPSVDVVSLDQLDATQREVVMDNPSDSDADLLRILRKGGRARTGDTNGPGKKASGLAA